MKVVLICTCRRKENTRPLVKGANLEAATHATLRSGTYTYSLRCGVTGNHCDGRVLNDAAAGESQ